MILSENNQTIDYPRGMEVQSSVKDYPGNWREQTITIKLISNEANLNLSKVLLYENVTKFIFIINGPNNSTIKMEFLVTKRELKSAKIIYFSVYQDHSKCFYHDQYPESIVYNRYGIDIKMIPTETSSNPIKETNL
jgi:hypothetical protein